jgi:hypothetical protein
MPLWIILNLISPKLQLYLSPLFGPFGAHQTCNLPRARPGHGSSGYCPARRTRFRPPKGFRTVQHARRFAPRTAMEPGGNSSPLLCCFRKSSTTPISKREAAIVPSVCFAFSACRERKHRLTAERYGERHSQGRQLHPEATEVEVPESAIATIFQPFYRVDGARPYPAAWAWDFPSQSARPRRHRAA